MMISVNIEINNSHYLYRDYLWLCLLIGSIIIDKTVCTSFILIRIPHRI